MRMRFKPYARAELLAADFHIHDPFHLQGQWHAQFPSPSSPLCWNWAAARAVLSPSWPPPTPKTITSASTSPTKC